ncbi:DUF533 domain-containing protein [Jannaschia sp. 2305UL9-9]|uniref:DUF533 domain-containing protein n=1 Tax=Jannaschia sp. 2305UL9-9 TaxID=3121638 RepID=UPI0035289046
MSLKRTAMKMALAFAASKGYEAFRRKGGLQGVRETLARSSAGGGSGGLGGLLGGLTGAGGRSGGIGGMLGALGGGGTGTAGTGAGGMTGLLGGLAAMAGGTTAAGGMDQDSAMELAEKGPQDEAVAAVMIRAIGQAVRADGQIDAQERAILDEMMGDAESDEDRAVMDAALSDPVHPETLARDVPRGHEAEVYAAALTAINPNSAAERAFLDRFATALALAPGEVARLHESAGKPI